MKKNKNLKIFIKCAILITYIFPLSIISQNQKVTSNKKPNFTGFWIQVSSTRDSRKLTEQDKNPIILVVSHNEPEFIIKRVTFLNGKLQAEIRTYFTDGRGETYRTEQIRQSSERKIPITMKSKTKWVNENELNIFTNIQIYQPSGMFPKRLYENWTISEDAKKLTRKIKYIDDNEYIALQKGELAPPKSEEWIEVFNFVTESDFDKFAKPSN